MAELVNIARPYAQAILELAKADGDYESWSQALGLAATLASDPQVRDVAHNPRVDKQQVTGLFLDIGGDALSAQAQNMLKLVIDNGRLAAFPSIAAQYEILRAEAERKVDAEVISAQEIPEAQLGKIAGALEKRLGRQVNLSVRLDDSLLGGAIVRAGDLVIDGSARGRLEKLASTLSR